MNLSRLDRKTFVRCYGSSWSLRVGGLSYEFEEVCCYDVRAVGQLSRSTSAIRRTFCIMIT
jgi:hypothetical protein